MSDKDKTNERKHETQKSPVSTRKAKKLTKLKEYLSKQESLKNSRKVSDILKKNETERTEEEKKTLAENEIIVRRIHKNKERRLLSEQRILETEDSDEVLQEKCHRLAGEILRSKQTVIYTGAGISTAASIPDYRGPQGVWTLLQKGEQLTPQDLSDAEPTVTHMCITALQKKGHVSHVVSQNCDGLHVRSGLSRKLLSEVHGNMYIEICMSCKPHREYVRLFDVTEQTGVRRHGTGRHCKICGGELRDTIVHFGEKGGVKTPYRWKEAVKAANCCDLILCLGSSLKILKKYSCLWCMDRARNKRPKLVIINLQWTPKDSDAFLKINGRCDDVLKRLMKILKYDIPQYSRATDPIFLEAIALEEGEQNAICKKTLERPDSLKHIPLNTMPRSPTPSLSSDSDYSASSASSSDDSDLSETETDDDDDVQIIEPQANNVTNSHVLRKEQLLAYYSNGRPSNKGDVNERDMDISSIISKVKDRVQQETDVKKMTNEDLFMLRSEKICNEAKAAMQMKTPTDQESLRNGNFFTEHFRLQNMSKEELSKKRSEQICNEARLAMQRKTFMSNEASKSSRQLDSEYFPIYQGSQPKNLHKNGYHKEHDMQESSASPSALLQNPPSVNTNESLTSHEEKLKYLQTLQSQLQALKQKQQSLKQEDPAHDSATKSKQSQFVNQDLSARPVAFVKNVWNHAEKGNTSEPVSDPYPTAIIKHIKVEPQNDKSANSQKQVPIKTQKEKQEQEIAEYLANEQLVTNDLINKQQKRFENEKMEMKRQQENDHRRMYQQFVMQVQVAEDTNLGEQKKAEMLQVFQMQQKLMLNKQTGQLQELFNKHQSQQKSLIDDIEQRRKAFIDSIQLKVSGGYLPESGIHEQQTFDSNTYGSQQSQSQLYPSVSQESIPGMFSPSHAGSKVSPQIMTSSVSRPVMSHNNSTSIQESALHPTGNRPLIPIQHPSYEMVEKQASIITAGQIQASHTDHVLTNQTVATSSQQDAVPATTVQTKIPGFNELVQGILTCESCALMKRNGMSKGSCSNCDSLKLGYGFCANPYLSAQTQNSHNDQPGMMEVSLPTSVSIPGNSQVYHTSAGSYANNDTSPISSQMPLVTPTYLDVPQISGQVSNFPNSNTHFYPVMETNPPNQNYFGSSQTLGTTSPVTTGHLEVGETSDQELSPVIPYTSMRVSASLNTGLPNNTVNNDQHKPSIQTSIQTESGFTGTKFTSPLSRFTNATHEIHPLAVKMEMTDTENMVKGNVNNMIKSAPHYRPRSQSEVFKSGFLEAGSVAEMKPEFSRSYSDDMLPMAIPDQQDGNVEINERVEIAAKVGKKRKSSTNATVPGWFGKGLNLKKKRK